MLPRAGPGQGNCLGLNLLQCNEDWKEWESKAIPKGSRRGSDLSQATGWWYYPSEPQSLICKMELKQHPGWQGCEDAVR